MRLSLRRQGMNKKQKIDPAEPKSQKETNGINHLKEDELTLEKEKLFQKNKSKPSEANSELQLNFNKNTNPLSSSKGKRKKKKESQDLKDQELSALNEKLKQALNDNLYLRAEFENFKRRSTEEINQLTRYGGERFISSLANEVLDDLDRAMQSVQKEESFNNLKKGLEMIQKKLSQLLKNSGVEIFDPTGKAFDPSYQEALSYIKTSKVPDGHVAETFKKAYKLHGKVIRPAQVVLAKKESH